MSGHPKNEKWETRLARRGTSQRAAILAGTFGGLGLLLYVLPLLVTVPTEVASVLQNVAFGMAFPAIFSVIWERAMTPVLADEMTAKIGLKRSVDDAGLTSVAVESDEDWDRILSGARRVEVYFDVDGSWWLGHRTLLKKAVERGCTVRAIVVDVTDQHRRTVIQSLIGFDKKVQDECNSQTGFYLDLGAEVRRSRRFPLSMVVVVDEQMIVRVNKVSCLDPTFLSLGVESRRSLGLELRRELDSIWADALAP